MDGLEIAMIAVVCSACDRRMLLPLSMVTGLTRLQGVSGQVFHELSYQCWCGAEGRQLIERITRR